MPYGFPEKRAPSREEERETAKRHIAACERRIARLRRIVEDTRIEFGIEKRERGLTVADAMDSHLGALKGGWIGPPELSALIGAADTKPRGDYSVKSLHKFFNQQQKRRGWDTRDADSPGRVEWSKPVGARSRVSDRASTAPPAT